MIEPDVNRQGRDRISGASEITAKSIRLFTEIIKNSRAEINEVLSRELIDSAREAIALQPSMGSILTLASMLVHKAVLLTKEKTPLEDTKARLLSLLEDRARRAELSAQKIAAIVNELLSDGMVISTYSRSSLVERAIIKTKDDGKKVTVLLSEGRPLFEGLLLARRLSDSGIETILVTDSVLPLFLCRSDIVLLGADAVTERSFINKAGTYSVCLVAREHNVPVLCLSETEKFLSSSTPLLKIDECDPAEVVNFALPNVSVKNIYFEETPLKLVRTFVTESGHLSPEEASIMAGSVELSAELERG